MMIQPSFIQPSHASDSRAFSFFPPIQALSVCFRSTHSSHHIHPPTSSLARSRTLKSCCAGKLRPFSICRAPICSFWATRLALQKITETNSRGQKGQRRETSIVPQPRKMGSEMSCGACVNVSEMPSALTLALSKGSDMRWASQDWKGSSRSRGKSSR